jgi:hypothetical protein
MLSATANATKSAQTYLKTISLKNFEMPPKIETLVFHKIKILYVEEALEYVFTFWIFNTIIFHVIFVVKKRTLYMNFSIFPCGK